MKGIDLTEYPPCPLCGQTYGMDHRDPTHLCLDCQCCGDCDSNDLCIAKGCLKEVEGKK